MMSFLSITRDGALWLGTEEDFWCFCKQSLAYLVCSASTEEGVFIQAPPAEDVQQHFQSAERAFFKANSVLL